MRRTPQYCMSVCLAISGAFAAACLAPQAVVANDELAPGETILDRKNPELDPKGVRIGSFRLYPTVFAATVYNSNIFAAPADEIDDWVLITAPEFLFQSDWGRHALALGASGEFASYLDESSENYKDGSFRMRLDLDLGSQTQLALLARVEERHEDRDSPDDVDGFEPTRLGVRRVEGEYQYTGSRVRLRFRGSAEIVDFDDVAGSIGIINNDDRDRTVQRVEIRAGYEVNEGLDLVIETRMDQRDYDDDLDDRGLNRDSESRMLGVGFAGMLSGKLYTDAVVGWLKRDFDDRTFENTDMFWFDSQLIWNISGLTSVTLFASRDSRETTIGTASTLTSTLYGLRVDHELRRSFVISASASGGSHDFVGIDREDDVVDLVLGAQYRMNRYFELGAELRRRQRHSSVAIGTPADFARNSFVLSAQLRW